MRLREALRPYINTLYRQAATDGSPVIRSLRYVFPTDTAAADVDDQIMLGDRYLGGACPPPSLQLTAHRSASNALLRVPIGKAYDCSTHACDVMRCSPCAGAERHIALCLPSQAAGGRGVVSILLQRHGDHADDCGRGSGARGRRPCRPRRGGGAEGHCAGAARQLPTIRKAGTRAQQTPGMNRAIFDRRTDLVESVVRIGQTQHIYIDMTKPVRAWRAARAGQPGYSRTAVRNCIRCTGCRLNCRCALCGPT